MNGVPLRRLAAVSYGLGQPPPTTESGVPILRATNIERGRIVTPGLIYTAIADLPLDRAPLLRAGEILVVRSGAYTGDSALITEEWAGAAPGYDLRVTPKQDVEPRFVAYSLLGRRALESMWLASSRAAQPHLNAEELGEVLVSAMPTARQRAIADFLDTETGRIDTLITKKRRLIDLLDERRSGVISWHLWSVPYRPVRLKHLCGLATSGNRDHSSFTADDSGVPCLRGLNVRPGRIDMENLLRIAPEDHARLLQTQLRPGDLAIVRSGNAGSAALIPPGFGEVNCVDLVVVRRSPRLDPSYLEYVVNSREAQEQVKAKSAGALLTHFNAVDVGDLTIPLVDIDQQRRVVIELTVSTGKLDGTIAGLGAQCELLQEHRQAIITAAVTGEIDIPGAAA